jgi:uncharacterized LabA/DUF88 family protein
MVFVDGGYLRQYLRSKWGNDEFSTSVFQQLVGELVEKVHFGLIIGELIRVYYYDAIAKEQDKAERDRQQMFFDELRQLAFCDVRLGSLVKSTNKGYKQKGVDILMAIDMLSKAYEKHYEIAVLVAGDGDFVSLVEAVKNTGARVYGAYIENHVAKELLDSLDNYTIISEKTLNIWLRTDCMWVKKQMAKNPRSEGRVFSLMEY